MPKPEILTIAGSLRRGSFNRRLLDQAAKRSSALDLTPAGLADIPLFDEDLEAEGTPAGVERLWNAVGNADGVIIATPEYNQSIPGVLKNAIDWLSRSDPQVLKGKPVAILGATVGGWGTRYAQAAARHTLTACGAFVMPTPQFFMKGAGNAFDDSGDLVEQADREALDGFLAEFAAWLKRVGDRG